MSDSVEYTSLMDYIKVSNKFNGETRAMLANLIHILILKEILDKHDVDFIKENK